LRAAAIILAIPGFTRSSILGPGGEIRVIALGIRSLKTTIVIRDERENMLKRLSDDVLTYRYWLLSAPKIVPQLSGSVETKL
jgi:hypothetical protein